MAHGSWRKARVKVPGLGRIHPGLLSVYLLVCLITIGLLIDGPRLAAVLRPSPIKGPADQSEPAVPALAGVGREGSAAPSDRVEDGSWPRLEKRIWRAIIDYTIPLIGLGQPAGPGTTVQGLIGQATVYFLGFQPTDPLSLLKAGVPLLGQVEGVGAAAGGEVEALNEGSTGPAAPVNPPANPPTAGTEPLILGRKIEVAIYSTHSSESFLPDLIASGRPYEPNAYSSDPALNVLRVGEELARELSSKYGLGTVQIRTLHDAEGYLGAYARSATTVQKLLKDYPDLRLIIDVHRDSAARRDTVLRIEGRDAARVMIIIGSGSRQLRQPNWQKNYALAKRLVAEIERLYPGLSRGISVKADRYNQHLSPNAILIEVGGAENSLDEELRTAGFLARAIAAMLGSQNVAGR